MDKVEGAPFFVVRRDDEVRRETLDLVYGDGTGEFMGEWSIPVGEAKAIQQNQGLARAGVELPIMVVDATGELW